MGDYRSKYVHQIGWQIKTHSDRWSGTDSRVTVEIIRDDQVVLAINIEPGNTTRLTRGESVFYYWTFRGTNFVPGDFTTWIGGLPFPDGVEFPDDVQGHLKCRFRIHGDDLWKKDEIVGYVKYTNYYHIPGTIDSFEWQPDMNWTNVGTFGQDVVLSTDSKEGHKTWTLLY